MLKRTWILELLIAVVAAGCGGTSHSASTKPSTTSATAARTPTTASTSLPDCTTVGIDPAQMHEGACTHGGIRWLIVDENHTLRLSTLSAKLAGVTTSKTVTGATATTPATGEFVTAAVTIMNELPAPQSFDQAHGQQAGLILAGAVFKEAVAAEGQTAANSCLKHNATAIEPGKSVTCAVIFDVPEGAAADLGKHGSGDLYVVNFGSDLAGGVVPQTIGQIRLYH